MIHWTFSMKWAVKLRRTHNTVALSRSQGLFSCFHKVLPALTVQTCLLHRLTISCSFNDRAHALLGKKGNKIKAEHRQPQIVSTDLSCLKRQTLSLWYKRERVFVKWWEVPTLSQDSAEGHFSAILCPLNFPSTSCFYSACILPSAASDQPVFCFHIASSFLNLWGFFYLFVWLID